MSSSREMSRKCIFIFEDENIKPIELSLSFMPAIGHKFEIDTIFVQYDDESKIKEEYLNPIPFKVTHLTTMMQPFSNMVTRILLEYVK